MVALQTSAELLAAAFRHHQAGRPSPAAQLYRQLLSFEPDHGKALLMLGMLQASVGAAEAERLLRRFLALPASPFEQKTVLLELAKLRQKWGRQEDAAEALRRAALLAPDWGEAWCRLGDIRRNEAILRRTVTVEPDNVHAWFLLAQILEKQKRAAEALTCNIEAGRRHGIQRHPCLTGKPIARVLLIGGAGSCNLPPEFLFDRQRYELLTTYLLPADAEGADVAALVKKLPPFDVAFNAIADLDRGGAYFPQAEALCRRLLQPVLNPPDQRIVRTGREPIGALLDGTKGLLLPATRRLSRRDLEDIGDPRHPILLRPAGAHGGEDLRQVESRAQIAAYLGAVPEEQHYVTDFVDYADGDGYYRKYRFIFVDREVYPYHLAVGRNWLLHYISSDMDAEARFRLEEERFLADWRATLPPAAIGAVEEIGRRLDLDYAGIDCAVARDGRLILFEANPCMLVHLRDSPERYSYKHRYVPRIAHAVDRMVERRRAAAAEKGSFAS